MAMHSMTYTTLEVLCSIETVVLATISTTLRTRDQTVLGLQRVLNTPTYQQREKEVKERRERYRAKTEKERIMVEDN